MVHAEQNTDVRITNGGLRQEIYESISRLVGWLDRNDYRGYDTFDGLNARFLRPLTFNSRFLRTILQQGVRRFPINVRPLLGIRKSHSTKGMAFLARGFLRLHAATGDPIWRDRAVSILQWLQDHQSPGYSGACWGNHFDYQSRGFYLPKGVPTVVWTSLIGHAFLDAYAHLGEDRFLRTASSACEHIVHDLEQYPEEDAVCISYIPGSRCLVHNANVLAAGFLARTYSYVKTEAYRTLAEQSIRYTARHQNGDSSWYYGEAPNLRWIDNFHTAYVLDSIKYYSDSTNDNQFAACMMSGYRYWKQRFFLPDGTPRYYNNRTLPVDIQCSSQAIDTLRFFYDRDPEGVQLAWRVAQWTIRRMQDPDGHFYYRRYSRRIVNRTPTLHWGQATMLCALTGLYAHSGE